MYISQWLISTYGFEKDLTEIFDFNKIKCYCSSPLQVKIWRNIWKFITVKFYKKLCHRCFQKLKANSNPVFKVYVQANIFPRPEFSRYTIDLYNLFFITLKRTSKFATTYRNCPGRVPLIWLWRQQSRPNTSVKLPNSESSLQNVSLLSFSNQLVN